MYIYNKTDREITLTDVLAGNALTIPAEGKSIEFQPNKRLLEKFLRMTNELELHATSGSQLAAASEIDRRVETIIILD